MAQVIVTFKIMPESPDIDLDALEKSASELITNYGADVHKCDKEPVAFGLVALKPMFVMDEDKGDTEVLEKQVADLAGVNSCEVCDVRRTVG